MSILTDADRTLLLAARRDNKGFHLATEWYCMGWNPLWYQYAFHQSMHRNVTWLAGIAAGKTTAVAASYMMDCITIPNFRALNTSVTAKQAELPFEMIAPWVEAGGRLDHLISEVSLRPYPIVRFKNGSFWIFRTAGKDGRFIRGMEFDRINYDEAGLDYTGETVKVLRGRLRGVRPDGSQRMARMDVITSPTDAPWLRERFERGDKEDPKADPAHFLSLRTTTYDNTRLDPEQIAMMEAEYSDDMIDVELKAQFPEYGASFFPKGHIHACTDQSLNDAMEEALRPETGAVKKGYSCDEHPRYGITRFELPVNPKHAYVMAGDPGTDGPPHRNAAVVCAFDVSVRPYQMVYFHWVNGMGSYNPFLSSYKYAMEKYRPVFKGMDTTGTQKAIDELAFENMGLSIDGINFARDKSAMLNSLSMDVTNQNIKWPVIKGLLRQMSGYSAEVETKKLPQDIVMTIAQAAFLARYITSPETVEEQQDPMLAMYQTAGARRGFRNRTSRGARR
jgi:hypothetical protein